MEALDLIDCLHRFRNNSVIFMGVRSDSTKICPLAGQHATTQKEVWRGGTTHTPNGQTAQNPTEQTAPMCSPYTHGTTTAAPCALGENPLDVGSNPRQSPGIVRGGHQKASCSTNRNISPGLFFSHVTRYQKEVLPLWLQLFGPKAVGLNHQPK
jgi:hypothetical protein|tara:strand:+ start:177 stop:638 length:462 start_codon:yes stop_codon:yes gene_type:complete